MELQEKAREAARLEIAYTELEKEYRAMYVGSLVSAGAFLAGVAAGLVCWLMGWTL